MEDQPAIRSMLKLVAQGKFSRENPQNPDTAIERDGRRYTIATVPNGQAETLSGVQRLIVRTFGAENVDPEEILRSSVDGLTPLGEPDSKCEVHVVLDGSGEVVSAVTGGRLDLLDEAGNPSGRQMFMVAYAVTDKRARTGGLAREAYISAIVQAAQEARAEGKRLAFAAGECTHSSEDFWNGVGWKRAYGERQDVPARYEELRYVQPALDFDSDTGEPAIGAGVCPEHFMIDSFDGSPPDQETVVAAVQAFYTWCNIRSRKAFASDEAHAKHRAYVESMLAELRKQVDESASLIYLDKAAREAMRQRGVEIVEHTAADVGDEGAKGCRYRPATELVGGVTSPGSS